MLEERIKATIIDVPDFPRPGILFKDITPILRQPALCKAVEDRLVQLSKQYQVDAVVGIESRGFLWGVGLAMRLNVPFIPARKAGKLPGAVRATEYDLEYGKAVVEISEGVIQEGWKVLVHDDLLATGGTTSAIIDLIRSMGAEVPACIFLVALDFLEGRTRLEESGSEVKSIVHYI
jgi:adenine phosphoribosyltransferase